MRCLFREGVGDVHGCEGLNVCACCSVAVLFALRPLPLSRAPLQVLVLPMLWMCTTVQQGHGRRLSSAWRAIGLQLHLSGTWLCSLVVGHQVRCLCREGVEDVRGCEGLSVCACCSVAVLFALRPLPLSRAPLQVVLLLLLSMLWIFTATPPQLQRARLLLPPLPHQQLPQPQRQQHLLPPPPAPPPLPLPLPLPLTS